MKMSARAQRIRLAFIRNHGIASLEDERLNSFMNAFFELEAENEKELDK